MKNSESYTEQNISGPTIQAILHTLDTQTGQYSVATQMRLNEARARAIASTRAAPFWRRGSVLAIAFSLSAACALVIFTQTQTVSSSAQLEATALYEATFGVDVFDTAGAIADAHLNNGLDETALSATELDEVGRDESVVANDLEFYAWLSKNSNTQRASEGSGS